MQPKETGSIKKGLRLKDISDLPEGYASRLFGISVTTAEELFSLINTPDPELRSGVQKFLETSDEQMEHLDQTLRGYLTPEFIAECESFVPKKRSFGALDPQSFRRPPPPIK